MKLRVIVNKTLAQSRLKSIVRDEGEKNAKHAAALVRQEAIRSIKVVSLRQSRRKPSNPNTPPHTIRERKSPLKTHLIYERYRPGGYIVGTKKLSGVSMPPVPGLHEHGGSKPVKFYEKLTAREKRPMTEEEKTRFIGYAKSRQIKRKKKRKLITARANYPRRPFMKPALLRIKSKFKRLF